MNATPKNTNTLPGRIALLCLLLLALAAPAVAQAAGKPTRRAPVVEPQSTAGVVNINTATEAQLELLPGIGPSKAQAIKRLRERRPFKATHELIRVRGIGRKTYRKLQSFLTVKGPTTLTQRPKLARKE